jgi:hypothetical protein
MRTSSRPHRPASRRRGLLLASALAVGGLAAFPAAASAQEACTVTRSSTSGVVLGANVASEPGIAIVVSHDVSGVSGATWTASGLPAGVSFNGSTGSISGAAAEGEYHITVVASGAGGTTCSRSFVWYVNAAESGAITPELPPEQIPSQSTVPATPDTPAAAPSSEGTLAFTGGDVAGLVVVGFGAIALGWVLLWSQRRRHADQPTT